jgi:hypothetical protein
MYLFVISQLTMVPSMPQDCFRKNRMTIGVYHKVGRHLHQGKVLSRYLDTASVSKCRDCRMF